MGPALDLWAIRRDTMVSPPEDPGDVEAGY